MTRQEVEAWGLVGAGAVIIVLLLLDYAPISGPVQKVELTEVPPGAPNQYTIEVNPSPNTPLPPWQAVFPPIPSPTYNLLVSQPCSCSCDEVSQEQGAAFAAQVDALNQQLSSGTIADEAAYFSETPYQNLFATNATQIGAFNAAVGLPAPIVTNNVASPGSASLPGGGEISYTFESASPWG